MATLLPAILVTGNAFLVLNVFVDRILFVFLLTLCLGGPALGGRSRHIILCSATTLCLSH